MDIKIDNIIPNFNEADIYKTCKIYLQKKTIYKTYAPDAKFVN